MARTTLTRNLRLRVSSDLSADAKYNLERIDTLAGAIQTDANGDVVLRSSGNIRVVPESNDVGGSGEGGVVTIGDANSPIANLQFFSDAVTLSTAVALTDQATGGSKSLLLKYKSDLAGAADLVADRSLLLDTEGSNRSLVLGGSLSVSGGDVAFSAPSGAAVTLPATGLLVSTDSADTLTNKVIAAGANTITGLTNSSIAAGAAISGLKVSPDFGAQNIQTSGQLSLVGPTALSSSLRAAQAGQVASVVWTLPASDGSNGQVLQTDGSGQLGWTTVNAPSAFFYSAVWVGTDGSSKTITHNFGTRLVSVQVLDSGNDYQTLEVESVTRPNANQVTLVASEAPSAPWYVLITRVG